MKFYTPFGVKEKKPLTMQLYIKKNVSLVEDLLSPFSHQLISHARSNEFPLRLWLTCRQLQLHYFNRRLATQTTAATKTAHIYTPAKMN